MNKKENTNHWKHKTNENPTPFIWTANRDPPYHRTPFLSTISSFTYIDIFFLQAIAISRDFEPLSAPTISSLLHSCPSLATYWRMCKCCVTYLLTYLPLANRAYLCVQVQILNLDFIGTEFGEVLNT